MQSLASFRQILVLALSLTYLAAVALYYATSFHFLFLSSISLTLWPFSLRELEADQHPSRVSQGRAVQLDQISVCKTRRIPACGPQVLLSEWTARLC